MENNLATWLVLIGGVVAVIGQFWTNTFYLSAIGGVVAIIGAFVK